ncbi:MAG: ATP-binding protein [Dehalococcoidia bacterium]
MVRRFANRQQMIDAVRGRWRRWLRQCGLSTLAVGMLVLVLRPLRLDVGLLNVALLLLLISVACAAAWGWVAGIYTSVVSNLAFNYFFVPPLYRFTVQQPDNALALGVFLVVAAITAGLLAQRRQSAREAERRARDTQTLLALSRTTRDQPIEQIPATICAWVVRDFPLQACTLYELNGDELTPVAHAGTGATELSRAAASVGLQAAASASSIGLGYRAAQIRRRPLQASLESGLLFLPIGVENRVVGVMRLRTTGQPLSAEHEALVEAFGDEAAAALHRGRLAQSASRAAEFEQSDRLKSALLSSVSHDLRTPLTSIKAAVANLLAPDVTWSDAAQHEFLDAIDRETDRLTRLVSDLLDLSRIEAGALKLDLDWNDLDELVRNAVYRAEQAAPGRQIRVQIDGELPLLRFDYVQIDRVLANLLDNALKYATADTPIDVIARAVPTGYQVSVRDRGPGIPPSERRRVFEPFYRAERRGTTGGSGLGLAICKGIIDAHAGRIWVEEDGGTAVRFVLPSETKRSPTRPPTGLQATGGVAGAASAAPVAGS